MVMANKAALKAAAKQRAANKRQVVSARVTKGAMRKGMSKQALAGKANGGKKMASSTLGLRSALRGEAKAASGGSPAKLAKRFLALRNGKGAATASGKSDH